MLRFDVKKFKKVSSDENSTTLMSPKGHHLKIAHKGISSKMKYELKHLPIHKAKGGMIESDEDKERYCPVCGTKGCLCYAKGGSVPWPYCPKCGYAHPNCKCYTDGHAAEHPDKMAKGGMVRHYDEGTTDGPVPSDTPEANPGRQSPATVINVGVPAAPTNYVMDPNQPNTTNGVSSVENTTNVAQPSSQGILNQASPNQVALNNINPRDNIGEYYKRTQQALGEQAIGKAEEASALGKISDATQAAQHEEAGNAAEANRQFQNRFRALDLERSGALQDINDHMINSEKHWQDHSKTASTIGLILGGMGAGITGGPNQALQYLQSQISNNIDAQKSNMGARKTLLEANLAQFGNINNAEDMTRVMLNDIAAHKIGEAAAKFGGPLAASRAAQAIGVLHSQSAELMKGIAAGGLYGPPGQGGGQGYINPEMLGADHKGSMVVLPDGTQRLHPRGAAAAAAAQEKLNGLNLLNSQLNEMNGYMNRTIPGTDKDAQIQQLRESISGNLNYLHGGPNNMESARSYQRMVPDGGAMRQGKAKGLMHGLKTFVGQNYKQAYIDMGYKPKDVPDINSILAR